MASSRLALQSEMVPVLIRGRCCHNMQARKWKIMSLLAATIHRLRLIVKPVSAMNSVSSGKMSLVTTKIGGLLVHNGLGRTLVGNVVAYRKHKQNVFVQGVMVYLVLRASIISPLDSELVLRKTWTECA
jgi:hypothetical protein